MQKNQALLISKLRLNSARHLQTALSVFASITGRASGLFSEEKLASLCYTSSVQPHTVRYSTASAHLKTEHTSHLTITSSHSSPLTEAVTPQTNTGNGWVKTACVSALLLAATLASGQAVAGNDDDTSTNDQSSNQLMIGSSETLKSGPNLGIERDLLLKHEDMVKSYTDNYVSLMKKKQPVNKTEECIISSDILDLIVKPNSMVFWEGGCMNGKADGFGRAYVVTSGRIAFEMLANLHADDPLYNTAYYTKNTSADSFTQYFFGKSVRIQSSGVLITHSKLNDDLTVGLQMSDKVNLITYQKDISLKSAYILNIKDYGNYAHFIHDLTDTPYRSLAMSYRMQDRQSNHNVGYEFTGMKTGVIEGKHVDPAGKETPSSIPKDVLSRVQEINDEVDINIENAISDAIDALKIVTAYKEAVCDPAFDNVLCKKMKCKNICDVQQSLTPEDARVKELLLRLVKHHNDRPLLGYLQSAVSGSKGSNLPQDPNSKNIFTDNDHHTNTSSVARSLSPDIMTSGRNDINHNAAANAAKAAAANANAPGAQGNAKLHGNMYPTRMSDSEREARLQDANAVAEAYKAAAESASHQSVKDRMSNMFGTDAHAPRPNGPVADPSAAQPDNNQYGYGDHSTYHPHSMKGSASDSFNSQSSAMQEQEPLYEAQGPSIAPRSQSVPKDYQEQRQRLREADQNIRPDLRKHDQAFTREQQQLIEEERAQRQKAIEEAKAEALKQLERDRARREELLELNSRPTDNDTSSPVSLGSQ